MFRNTNFSQNYECFYNFTVARKIANFLAFFCKCYLMAFVNRLFDQNIEVWAFSSYRFVKTPPKLNKNLKGDPCPNIMLQNPLPETLYKGLFKNYVMLKLPTHSPPLHLITNDHKIPFTLYDTWNRYPAFIICFSFLKLKKQKQRYAPTWDTSTHVFKKLKQIVRFK